MKEGWKTVRLGDICRICDFVSNGSFASLRENVKYYHDPEYAVMIRLADYSNGFDKTKFVYTDEHGYLFTAKSHLHGGEIIMCNVGSVGSLFLCPTLDQPMTLAPNTISIETDNNPYFSYYFQSPTFLDSLNSITSQTTLRKFNKTNFKSLIIQIPSQSEQQRIVTFLDTEFAKIDALKAKAEQSLQNAKDLFQAALKEMMEPKEGWNSKSLKEITTKIGSGATPKGGKNVYIEKGCSQIRSLNVHNNCFKYENLAHITEEAASALKGVAIQKEDVLFNITGASIARCCVVPEDILPARVNQHVSIIRCKDEVVPQFLCFTLICPQHQKTLLGIGEAGSTRQAITKTDLETHVVSFPDVSDQKEIISKISKHNQIVQQLQSNYTRTLQLCADLKQSLLKQVFE